MILLSFALGGCANPETVPEGEVVAKVVIPKAAATRTVVSAVDDDGDGTYEYVTSDVTDVRTLGPIYIGAFGGIDDLAFPYAHPAMGPVTTEGQRGDTFPYGGATLGRLDYACYTQIACKVTTGRFKDYDELLDYFRNDLGLPVQDAMGNEVVNGDTMRQQCLEYFSATSDAEMAFIGEDNLSFAEEGDDFVAEVTLAHTNRVDGMSLWAFMDAPEIRSDQVPANGSFTTCDLAGGRNASVYTDYGFYEGASYYNILNAPSTYIQYGDWVSDGDAVVHFDADLNQTNDVTININFEYEAG